MAIEYKLVCLAFESLACRLLNEKKGLNHTEEKVKEGRFNKLL